MVRDVIGVGEVHRRIERGAGVDRAWDVEIDHLFPERIPPFAADRRRERLLAAGDVGIDVATDKAQVVNAALKLIYPFLWPNARGLRQLADGRNLIGPALRHAGD